MENASGLEQCKKLIETSLGWGDPASWTNEDFETLSDRIADRTSVRLSVSTLKRIWGKVKYDSSPTMATLNALARYAGFEGWRDLANTQHRPVGDSKPNTATTETPLSYPRPRTWVTPLIVVTIASAILISFIGARIVHNPSDPNAVRFEHHSTSESLPNSVVFNYDATALHPQKLMIQQSWDPTRREKVDPDSKQHTSIYYYPGFFRAKLVVDGEIKKQSDVYVPTKGWKAIIQGKPLPVYLSQAEITLDSGHMGISAHTLEAKTGSSVFSNRMVGFYDVHEFSGISGDHFLLKATIRNTSTVEQSLCRKAQILIMGKENPILVPLADKGCISSLSLYTGSAGINGKDHDLSAFGCDWTQWQELTCSQENGILNISLNGKLIFSMAHNKSIGDIIGINIGFEGTGEIKQATLKGFAETLDLLTQP
jgi:hypothetical protein